MHNVHNTVCLFLLIVILKTISLKLSSHFPFLVTPVKTELHPEYENRSSCWEASAGAVGTLKLRQICMRVCCVCVCVYACSHPVVFWANSAMEGSLPCPWPGLPVHEDLYWCRLRNWYSLKLRTTSISTPPRPQLAVNHTSYLIWSAALASTPG